MANENLSNTLHRTMRKSINSSLFDKELPYEKYPNSKMSMYFTILGMVSYPFADYIADIVDA